jgi:hypothetical protein
MGPASGEGRVYLQELANLLYPSTGCIYRAVSRFLLLGLPDGPENTTQLYREVTLADGAPPLQLAVAGTSPRGRGGGGQCPLHGLR